MAKQVRSMTIQALIKLRDEVADAISSKAAALKKELAAVGADYAEVGRIALYGKKKSKSSGTTVAPKYRDPKTGQTWSGRGAPARWLVEYEKKGKKRDSFLVDKPKGPVKRKVKAANKGVKASAPP